MSSYSLTEALKHSRYRTQQLRLQQVSPPVVHKSYSEPAGMMIAVSAGRRRQDEIVSVPIRPWHSPQGRINCLSSTSPPSFSLESGGPRRRLHQLAPNANIERDVSATDDRRSVGTEMCVSDTISQDASVSDHFLRERSARIRRSHNCSNSSHQLVRRRQRSSKRQRGGGGGDGGGHQQGKGKSLLCSLLPTCQPRLEWPLIGKKGTRTDKYFGCGNCNGQQYPMSSHMSGLFVNANCMLEQKSHSHHSELSEPEFGREDLKVRGHWHDSLSNEESATQATMTDGHTRSGELGTDLSALTLSRTELSSTQAADARRHPSNNGSPQDPTEVSQATSHVHVQANHMQDSYPHVPVSYAMTNQQMTAPSQQQAASHAPTMSHQTVNPAPVNQQSAKNSMTNQRQQQPPIYRQAANRQPANHASAASRIPSSCQPIGQNSSNSSFSLNQSERSTRESASAREEEVIPASDDLVHVSVVSCTEVGSRSEEDTTAPVTGTVAEADRGAESTLGAESDRLAGSVMAADDVPLRLGCVQTATTAAAASVSLAGVGAGFDADVRRPSRFGRLKTPEICKRSFLSVLRHSIAQGHVSHRAKGKTSYRSQTGN